MSMPPLPAEFAGIPEQYVQPGLSLGQIYAILHAHRAAILIIFLTVMCVAMAVVAILPRSYTATATVMVSYDVNDPLNGEEFPTGLLSSYIATQTELMQSPDVLLPVVDRLDLTKDKDLRAGYREGTSTLREWVAAQMAKNLAVFQGPADSHLIHISYTANHPAQAAAVANAISDVYMEQDFARSTDPVRERAQRYTEQLAQLEAKVKAAQDDVTAFHQRNGLIDENNTADVDIAQLANLEEQLVAAQNARRAAEARATADQSVGDEVLASPLIQTLKTQLANQQSELAELETNLLPQHPHIIELKTQIASTREALDTEMARYSNNASSALSSARQVEAKLQAAVDAQRARVLNVGKMRDESAKYELALASTQEVYKRALEGYDRIMFASNSRYTSVNVVSRARAPVKATKPKVLVYLAAAAVGALGLGLFAPLLWDLTHRRVRCRDDMERDHGVEVLAEFGPISMPRHAG
jgi:uncharacterized protein involved in exopolysaccharide biosynthesis